MVFSSSAFIVYFLPITLLGFLLFSATGLRRLVLAWLTLCSLVFYAWGAADNLPLLGSDGHWRDALPRRAIQESNDRGSVRFVHLTRFRSGSARSAAAD